MLYIPTYFAPIAQYVSMVKNKAVFFEVEDNYQKQTYRNRCHIYAANGLLRLNIPVVHTKSGIRQKTKDIRIDQESHWQKTHLKSIQTAYRSSPYFEFYEDDLLPIFEQKQDFLLDLNLQCHAFVMDALQEAIPFDKTTSYEVEPALKDERHLAIAKGKQVHDFNPYVQVFDDKFGFLPNLSILDLLFMEGPNTITYLVEN